MPSVSDRPDSRTPVPEGGVPPHTGPLWTGVRGRADAYRAERGLWGGGVAVLHSMLGAPGGPTRHRVQGNGFQWFA